MVRRASAQKYPGNSHFYQLRYKRTRECVTALLSLVRISIVVLAILRPRPRQVVTGFGHQLLHLAVQSVGWHKQWQWEMVDHIYEIAKMSGCKQGRQA